MNFEPNVGRIVVELETESEKSEGGLFLPVTMERSTVKNAVIRAMGTPRIVDGNPTAMAMKVGDRVVIDTIGAPKLKIEGKEMILLRGEDVVGLLH